MIVRLSDFKTNEYASLLGGTGFEPKEENPMLGFRGASRYAHPAYAAGFALECAALRRIRQDMGLINLSIMVPFCRRVEEARRVLDAMVSHGLKRGTASCRHDGRALAVIDASTLIYDLGPRPRARFPSPALP